MALILLYCVQASFRGTLGAINELLQNIEYAPDPNVNGLDVLAIAVDYRGSESEKTGRAEFGFEIEIKAVNDALFVGDCETLIARRRAAHRKQLDLLACPEELMPSGGEYIIGCADVNASTIEYPDQSDQCANGTICVSAGSRARVPLVQVDDADDINAPGHTIYVKLSARHGQLTVFHPSVTFYNCNTSANCTSDIILGNVSMANRSLSLYQRMANGLLSDNVPGVSGPVLEFSGAIADVNAALQNATYLSPQFVGNDSIEIEAYDLDCCGIARQPRALNQAEVGRRVTFGFGFLPGDALVPVLISAGDVPPEIIFLQPESNDTGDSRLDDAQWVAFHLMNAGDSSVVELNFTVARGQLILPLGHEDLLCEDGVVDTSRVFMEACAVVQRNLNAQSSEAGHALRIVATVGVMNSIGSIGYLANGAHIDFLSSSVRLHMGHRKNTREVPLCSCGAISGGACVTSGFNIICKCGANTAVTSLDGLTVGCIIQGETSTTTTIPGPTTIATTTPEATTGTSEAITMPPQTTTAAEKAFPQTSTTAETTSSFTTAAAEATPPHTTQVAETTTAIPTLGADATAAAQTTTPEPEPAIPSSPIFVELSVSLPLSKDEFTAERRKSFKAALAGIAGLPATWVQITAVRDKTTRRRRLLAAGIDVECRVTTSSADAAKVCVPSRFISSCT